MKKIIPFDNSEKFPVDSLNELSSVLHSLPSSKFEIEIRKPKRTQRQNAMIHPIFEEVSTRLDELGWTIPFGKFEMSPTSNMVKEFFVQCYLAGKRTSSCDTRELAEAIDKFLRNINAKLTENGLTNVYIKSAELLNLLNQKN